MVVKKLLLIASVRTPLQNGMRDILISHFFLSKNKCLFHVFSVTDSR